MARYVSNKHMNSYRRLYLRSQNRSDPQTTSQRREGEDEDEDADWNCPSSSSSPFLLLLLLNLCVPCGSQNKEASSSSNPLLYALLQPLVSNHSLGFDFDFDSWHTRNHSWRSAACQKYKCSDFRCYFGIWKPHRWQKCLYFHPWKQSTYRKYHY